MTPDINSWTLIRFELSKEKWNAFVADLANPQEYSGADEMTKFIFDQGMDQGLAVGVTRGKRILLRDIIKLRSPSADEQSLGCVANLDDGQIGQLLPQIMEADSLGALGLPLLSRVETLNECEIN